MPALETPTPPEPTPTPTPAPEPTPDPDPSPILARIEDVRSDLLARMTSLEARPAGATEAHPLARWDSLTAYMDAAYDDRALAPLLGRALADQLTGDNPGVMPPTYLTTIVGIMAFARRAIAALGGADSLGDSGMSLHWPYLDPALDLDTLVAVQAAEKTQIASVKVKFLDGQTAIATYAGGSDISYQLIRRSSPSYRDAYNRVLTVGWARTTERAFEAALIAGATGTQALAGGATADALRAALFAASAKVEDATGMPATVVLASPADFLAWGGLPGLYPPQYGTQNVAGTASASTLRINVSGLEIVRAPFLLTGSLVTNELAASWHEDGPFPISAEDVAKLGQNVAVWSMGATSVEIPAGIIKLGTVAPKSGEAEADAKALKAAA